MSLACRILSRGFVPALEGELGPGRRRRLERHLVRCAGCRARLDRVRAGHEAGRRFGRVRPDFPDPFPAFEEIALPSPGRSRRPAIGLPVLAGLAAALAAVLALAGRPPFRPRGGVSPGLTADAGFTPLTIREFAGNSRRHVVTEGYVHNVYFDKEEGTLHIKLAEAPHRTEPFVICEVRDSRGLTIPAEGSRVRVYGRARFDAQPGRGWHEVNPVTDISVLKR